MRWDYQTIKRTAHENGGVTTRDLFVLAPQNDPFYCGSPAQVRDAEWFADWFNKLVAKPVHVRGFHYLLVSQQEPPPLPTVLTWTDKETGGKRSTDVYINENRCWEWLLQAAKFARYLQLVPMSMIVDKRNPSPHQHAEYLFGNEPSAYVETGGLSEPSIMIGGFAPITVQPYHLEVWTEKSTVLDNLLPICKRYYANLVVFSGFSSDTAIHSLMLRLDSAQERPARIFYISDHDPAGLDMPIAMSRDLEWMLDRFDRPHDVRIKPLALTSEQVETLGLPTAPAKGSDARAKHFMERFGGATELDALLALLPGELENIVSAALDTYHSHDATRELQAQYNALRQAIRAEVREVMARYQDEIAAMEAMGAELDEIEIDPAPFKVERPAPHVAEDDGWLFDSERDYLGQLEAYKVHKGLWDGD